MRLRLRQKQVDRRLRIVVVPGALEARRNGVEMEMNKDKPICRDVAVTCDDVRCFLIKCFGIELVLYDLYLTRFDLTIFLLFDTFFTDIF